MGRAGIPGAHPSFPLLPPEPASPSAEGSGCADLLSGVRDLHMTCPFVNLAPQLFASLHLCLPVLLTSQAPARLRPPLPPAGTSSPALPARPPTSLRPEPRWFGWLLCAGFLWLSSFPPVLLVLFLRWLLLPLLRLLLLLLNPGSQRRLCRALPESAGLTASLPFSQGNYKRVKNSPPAAPFCRALLHCIAWKWKREGGKNLQTAWMLG